MGIAVAGPGSPITTMASRATEISYTLLPRHGLPGLVQSFPNVYRCVENGLFAAGKMVPANVEVPG
jgi:hypothetical protein